MCIQYGARGGWFQSHHILAWLLPALFYCGFGESIRRQMNVLLEGRRRCCKQVLCSGLENPVLGSAAAARFEFTIVIECHTHV